MTATDLFLQRKSLDEICRVPERIISVYSLEKHVWADSNAVEARKARRPELQTIEEFRIDPVRHFVNDVLRNLAAPYNPSKRDEPIGQGYWIQAEFGSGKSHLLCFLATLALGRKEAWALVQRKEADAGRGKRESLYRFWEEGLEAKSGKGKKGILVVVRTLVGSGSGTVGLAGHRHMLAEYVLDAVKDQLQLETGKNLSLYPADGERQTGTARRTLTITASYHDGRKIYRKSRTHRFGVQLNAEQVIRRIGNLGAILGLTPKSLRGGSQS